MNAQTLAGRVAMVTGGGRRIGRVIALTFARAGADVAVNYYASRREALNTVKEIQALGRRAEVFRADVSKAAQVRRMFREFERAFDSLDVLVNNAGVFFPVRWDRITEKDWDRQGRVFLRAGGGKTHAGEARRPHHQHLIAWRPPSLAKLRALLRVEGREHHADPLSGEGARAAHPCEQRGAWNDSISG